MSTPRKAQQKEEEQQNIYTHENAEGQHTPKEHEDINAHEAQQVLKPISQNIGATIQTPLGPGTLQQDALTDEEIKHGKQFPEDVSDTLDAFMYKAVKRFVDGEGMKQITAIFPDAKRWSLETGKERTGAIFIFTVLTAIIYYIDTLPDYLETHGITKTLEHFAGDINPDTGKSFLLDFLNFKEDAALDPELLKPEALDIIAHKPIYFSYPCDKVSDAIFNAPETQPGEVLNLEIHTNPKDKINDPYFSYSIDFDKVALEVPFVRALTPFDKRLLLGYGALMDAGNPVFSNYQLFRAMGYDRKPTPAENKEIDISLSKMNIEVKINNKTEIEAGYHYKEVGYHDIFLPHKRIDGVRINGKEVDMAIKPYDYPFILTLAADRNELQKIPFAVLQTSGSINRSNLVLGIQDYLIRRISDIIRGYSKQTKILYSAMYQRFNLDSSKTKPRQRLREYAQRFLQHCKDVNWIKGYETQKDGLIIHV